jgi:hypothetical protein
MKMVDGEIQGRANAKATSFLTIDQKVIQVK